jgi:tetratricopeptide (TPR) repeat protein
LLREPLFVLHLSMHQRTAEFDRYVAEAMACFSSGKFSEAAAAYRAASTILPNHAGVLHNLGVVAASQGDHRTAITWFDSALALERDYASAHYNRAVAHHVLGRNLEAIDGFARAVQLEPENYAGHRAIAFCLLAMGERARSLDHFARTYDLRRGDDRIGVATRSLRCANRIKLRHDAEQFRYLARVRRDGKRFELMARNYESVCGSLTVEVTELTESDFEILGEEFNTAITAADAPELPGRALAPRSDREEIVERFAESAAGAVQFDELLSPRALASLRRYLLESTIWHDFTHIEGFVASYLEDGLACPLLLQIADELRREFPEILGSHTLTQAWAFKAVEQTGAIDVHADDAAFSVNFWVTPASANLNPARGGMGVCLVQPPSGSTVRDYHADGRAAAEFLEHHRTDTLTVPYRDNRAVLFKSRLLHYSDAPEFDQRYENHRINVTLLFG